jgi:hypothetical protein
MIASNTITKASNFMLSSFVQEIKVLNFLPMSTVLSDIAETHSIIELKKLKVLIPYYVSLIISHKL